MQNLKKAKRRNVFTLRLLIQSGLMGYGLCTNCASISLLFWNQSHNFFGTAEQYKFIAIELKVFYLF